MAAPPTLPADESPQPEETLILPELPQEEFWEAYNKRMEFPLAAVGTVFLHVLVGAVLVYLLVGLMNAGEDRSNPPLKLMRVGGMGDVGEGSSGSGGNPDQEIIRDVDPYQARQKAFATPQALADARANIQKIVLDDPNGKLAIAPANAAAYQDLDETLRKKLLGVGGRQGDGNQLGMGDDGSPGSGPGGTGADSTRARGLRWVLRFRVIPGGRDYIDQLRTMRAEILVPLTSDKDCLIVPDLSNPRAHRVATNEDFNRLAGKIQFSDNRPAMVREVLDTLGIHSQHAKAFWAFFPKDIEEELAMKEKAYRNKRPEDIEETVFKVTIRGGKPEVVVEDQILKR